MISGSSSEARRRLIDREDDIRGPYFRDQTAIIHSSPFRRLKHKTQVFFAPKNDHICTRIEHVLHVASIAATICKGLNQRGFSLDLDLAEAIGLGHDVGHAPFGHTGEQILDTLASDMGGFVHEIHSLRVLDKLCNGGKGLNLTYAVRDGVLFHCGELFERNITPRSESIPLLETVERALWSSQYPCTWEGSVVRMSDKVAYLGRDVEDAVEAGIIDINSVPPRVRMNLGTRNGEIIDALVVDIIASSNEQDGIRLSDDNYQLMKELFEFCVFSIYNHDLLLEYRSYSSRILKEIFEFLHALDRDRQRLENPRIRLESVFAHFRGRYRHVHDAEEASTTRRIIDFMAGMSDMFALECMRDICLPHPQF